MEELRVCGHYYKLFKGDAGIPREVTVIAIDGAIVTIINGHHTKEELDERSALIKMRCNKNKIITKVTDRQKKLIDAEKAKIQKIIDEADRSLESFKNGVASVH